MGFLSNLFADKPPQPTPPRRALLPLLRAEDMALLNEWGVKDRAAANKVLMLMLIDLQKQIRELRDQVKELEEQ